MPFLAIATQLGSRKQTCGESKFTLSRVGRVVKEKLTGWRTSYAGFYLESEIHWTACIQCDTSPLKLSCALCVIVLSSIYLDNVLPEIRVFHKWVRFDIISKDCIIEEGALERS